MIIPIKTDKKPWRVQIRIKVRTPLVLTVRATDPTRPNTSYLSRLVPFKKNVLERTVTIPLPISPDTLAIELRPRGRHSDTDFHIESFDMAALPRTGVWADGEMHDFIEFSERFVQRAGYIRPGFYYSPDYQFLLHLVPEITDQFNITLATPARTHRVTGRHQVAQEQFKKLSIPIRMFIMLHERQHFAIPTRKERTADLAALRLYLDLGYPKIEAVYAATKVFRMHTGTLGREQVTRTRDIIDFIDDYELKRNTA